MGGVRPQLYQAYMAINKCSSLIKIPSSFRTSQIVQKPIVKATN